MNNHGYHKALRKALGQQNRSAAKAVLPFALAREDYASIRKLGTFYGPAREAILDVLEARARYIFSQLEHSGAPTVVDLCSGAGMASLGFESAGFETLLGVDIWKPAAQSFELNHPRAFALEAGVEELVALKEERGVVFPEADVVVTGPPCQDDSRCRRSRAELCDLGRGAVKIPTLVAAAQFNPSWIVMEAVGKSYDEQMREAGARQIFWLEDDALGGSTIRRRRFYVWTPTDAVLDIPASFPPSRGWGPVLASIGLPVTSGSLLATEANARFYPPKHRDAGQPKRWALAKAPDQPANAAVGGDRRFILRTPGYEDYRLSPEEGAALQGFPELELAGDSIKARNTQVGNGWTKRFGEVIGSAIMRIPQ
jgi:site-specific DNA-cytosine methylase